MIQFSFVSSIIGRFRAAPGFGLVRHVPDFEVVSVLPYPIPSWELNASRPEFNKKGLSRSKHWYRIMIWRFNLARFEYTQVSVVSDSFAASQPELKFIHPNCEKGRKDQPRLPPAVSPFPRRPLRTSRGKEGGREQPGRARRRKWCKVQPRQLPLSLPLLPKETPPGKEGWSRVWGGEGISTLSLVVYSTHPLEKL